MSKHVILSAMVIAVTIAHTTPSAAGPIVIDNSQPSANEQVGPVDIFGYRWLVNPVPIEFVKGAEKIILAFQPTAGFQVPEEVIIKSAFAIKGLETELMRMGVPHSHPLARLGAYGRVLMVT